MIVASLLVSLALLESRFMPDTPAPRQEQVTASAEDSACPKKAMINFLQPKAPAADAPGVANLPDSMGRSFTSLDAYLGHLECYSQPIDGPWWKEIQPGVYKHITTATNARPNEIATRSELMKRFGFSR